MAPRGLWQILTTRKASHSFKMALKKKLPEYAFFQNF